MPRPLTLHAGGRLDARSGKGGDFAQISPPSPMQLARPDSSPNHDVSRQRRHARWWHANMRRLLERVRQSDQTRLAECASRKRHARGTRQGVEARRERAVAVIEESAGHDDAGVAGLCWRASPAVTGEEQRVEIVSVARNPVGTVEDRGDRTARACDVLRAIALEAERASCRQTCRTGPRRSRGPDHTSSPRAARC